MRTFSFLDHSNSGQNQRAKYFRWRFLVITVILIGVLSAGLLLQMYRWQVSGHEKYAEMALEQRLSNARLPSSRGTIFAADGAVLAVDEPVWDVYASVSTQTRDRDQFEQQRELFVQTVAEQLELDPEVLNSQLTNDFHYVLIKRGISSEEKQFLEDENLFGLYFEEKERRIYPHGSLACHVLGFVGKDEDGNDVGNYGLEGYYSGDLVGKEGFTYEEKDSRGNVILTGEYDPVLPREGKNIELTIETGLQSRVEELLEKGVIEHQAKSGTVIIMDPQTGGILAMATFPSFNPNFYWKEQDSAVFRNRAVSDVYEYGSVQKVLTLSMALEEGEITPETVCQDLTGSIEVADYTIYTWDKMPDGDMLPKDILKNSNNVCAVKVGQKVGIERNYNYLKKFGIGDFVGIGLQDEATSYLLPLAKWNEVDLAVSSFGQSISATPLQILSAFSTVANDGVRMRPYIVKRLFDETEEIVIEPEAIEQVVSSDTAYKMQEMMKVSLSESPETKRFAIVNTYAIAGKTGTAQIPFEDRIGYYDDRTNATFIAYAPAHDAKMIMIVRLEEPKSNPYAAMTAVPVWMSIFQDVSLDLGVAPVL